MNQPKELKPVSETTIAALREKLGTIIEESMSSSDSGRNDNKIKNGFMMMFRILIPIMELGELDLLDDQASWVITRLPQDGIDINSLSSNLDSVSKALRANLERSAYLEIQPYMNHLSNRVKQVLHAS